MAILSDLPDDILALIAKLLKKLEDFTCFRSVSRSLRAAAKKEYFEGFLLRQRTPYLLLPAVKYGKDDIGELYSLVEGERIVASVEIPNFKRKKCFESLGWLLVVEEDGNMCLLDPFSGTEIPVPHQNTFPDYGWIKTDEYVFIRKMVLSSRPNENSDFVLMVICGRVGKLCFWRLGDKAWNMIDTKKPWFKDVVFDGGTENFYAINRLGIISVFNLTTWLSGDDHVDGHMIIDCGLEAYLSKYAPENLYILKTVGDTLLLISGISRNNRSGKTTEFQVYQVDIMTSTWKEIYSLGDMAVFLGHNSTIGVDASRFSGIKANHIYFTDCVPFDVGTYNMETGTVEPIYSMKLWWLSKDSPSTWITPCF